MDPRLLAKYGRATPEALAEADLPGELREHLLVGLGELQRAVGPAHDDHPEELP